MKIGAEILVLLILLLFVLGSVYVNQKKSECNTSLLLSDLSHKQELLGVNQTIAELERLRSAESQAAYDYKSKLDGCTTRLNNCESMVSAVLMTTTTTTTTIPKDFKSSATPTSTHKYHGVDAATRKLICYENKTICIREQCMRREIVVDCYPEED